jgi:hypothetical protein
MSQIDRDHPVIHDPGHDDGSACAQVGSPSTKISSSADITFPLLCGTLASRKQPRIVCCMVPHTPLMRYDKSRLGAHVLCATSQ